MEVRDKGSTCIGKYPADSLMPKIVLDQPPFVQIFHVFLFVTWVEAKLDQC